MRLDQQPSASAWPSRPCSGGHAQTYAAMALAPPPTGAAACGANNTRWRGAVGHMNRVVSIAVIIAARHAAVAPACGVATMFKQDL